MIQLDIPESVVNFTEGRVSTKIDAKHCMGLARHTDKKYGRCRLRYVAQAKGGIIESLKFAFFLYSSADIRDRYVI